MVRDLRSRDLHDLENVDLITFRSLSWVFPNERIPVDEILPCSMPTDEIVRPPPGTFFQEVEDLAASMKYA